MPVLHLGVTDIPYSTGQTTGDVASILESKYEVMGHFATAHEAGVAADLESSLEGELENLLLGAPRSSDPFAGAASKIEHRFRQFLSMKEMDRLGVPGVPTAASLAGYSR